VTLWLFPLLAAGVFWSFATFCFLRADECVEGFRKREDLLTWAAPAMVLAVLGTICLLIAAVYFQP
jgi:hypothetical protein